MDRNGDFRKLGRVMCNAYRIQPKRGELAALARKVSEAAGRQQESLVRKTDPAWVLRADERLTQMRWGFHRSFNPAINNTRSDHLDSAMWSDSYQTRRCILPMSSFYEWGPAPQGKRQAYDFQAAGDDYLWAAGIWETHPEFGECCSMLTTTAVGGIARIHDRMPVLLGVERIFDYLGPAGLAACESGRDLLRPPEACPSPLARPKPPSSQQELF